MRKANPLSAAWRGTKARVLATLTIMGDRLGTLEPGRLADLVAYRRDPLSIPVDQLRSLRATFTMVGGRVIWRAGDR